ncbi:hypothetical protein [Flavihumibacter sp. UBA7668]|uniref:hypothetical protein n=1 Tax=Flavihumibacter sp. UBA7668 TaxID=1946542 RepID=UPI0025C581E9|nr:hypothetical protein [Flavihumibacter sp. UBA7668]
MEPGIDTKTPINPNKQLWEKGDFTQIAATMHESGEALVIVPSWKGMPAGCLT